MASLTFHKSLHLPVSLPSLPFAGEPQSNLPPMVSWRSHPVVSARPLHGWFHTFGVAMSIHFPHAAPHTVGKYLVSPLVRALENGWFASSVSIRSGSGCSTTDRVLRLTRLFQCAREAAAYARAEALQWIAAPQKCVVA